jgi:hypothetical protein
MQALRKRTREAAPARLRELRRAGVSGDDAFHRLEEELDLADLAGDRRELGRRWGTVLAVKPDTGAKDRHPAATGSPPVALRDPRGPPRVGLHRARQRDSSSSPATHSEKCLSFPVVTAAVEARTAWSGQGSFRCGSHSPCQCDSIIWLTCTQCRLAGPCAAGYEGDATHVPTGAGPEAGTLHKRPITSCPNSGQTTRVRTIVVQLRQLPAQLCTACL